MGDTNEEERLLKRILLSEFEGTKQQRALLEFLFDRRKETFLAKEIEVEHYKRPVSLIKDEHTREEIRVLRQRLSKYAVEHPEERLQCSVITKKNEGYQMVFTRIERHRTPSEVFWEPHLKRADDTIVISGHHLFFFDPSLNRMVRYYDFNMDAENKQALEEFLTKHPAERGHSLQALHNAYLSTGEIQAYEALQRWFHARTGRLIPRSASRDLRDQEVYKKSPILLSRPVTNKFIRKIMDSVSAKHLGYRIDSALGAVRITNPTDPEKASLKKFGLDGEILGPMKDWSVVFGLLTRLPNPSGYGHITIICADYWARVVTQIVDATTNDELAGTFLQRMNWPEDKPLPESFEVLFSVTLAPADLEAESLPTLLCWRLYENL